MITGFVNGEIGMILSGSNSIPQFERLDLDFAVVYGTARTIQMASVHGMEKCGFSRLPDRKLRDWPVYYYECRREAFLARHVLHLNQRIADMDPDFQPQPAPASANDGRLATQV